MPEVPNDVTAKRLLSLDVMRGIIMLLLAGEACMLYETLKPLQNGYFGELLVQQFFHHPWHGLRFWDLVQPAFMTMAGASLYISFYYKQKKGISWQQNFKHIAIRCAKLFLLGTALHCVYAGQMVWELWNVLTQLTFTTIIAYFIIRWPAFAQILFSVALLLITEILYRCVNIPGYSEPFVSGKNFGNLADLWMMGKVNTDGWVAINIIPTAAHTIWGVLAGKLLISSLQPGQKIMRLIIAGGVCLLLGYGLDLLHITPIIKRIATSSFALASGGWVLLIMALLYWITDVRQWKRFAWVFVVVGMNAIFIYLFFETVGHQWLNPTVEIFVGGIARFIGISLEVTVLLSAITTLLLEWGICFWLYKKKIFFKL